MSRMPANRFRSGPRGDALTLYAPSGRKKGTAETVSQNGLIQNWPETMRLARQREQELNLTVQDKLAL